MEKSIVLSDLSGKFTKNFDTFSKMDSFIEIKCGKFNEKTQIANGQGKQPKWSKTFTIKAATEKQIQFIVYDEDVTQNQYMGTGRLGIASLKASGSHSLDILGEDGKSIGAILFKYDVKETAGNPTNDKQTASNNNIKSDRMVDKMEKTINDNLDKKKVGSENVVKGSGDKRITIKNIVGKFTKDFDLVGKMDIFLRFFLDKEILETEEAAGTFSFIDVDKGMTPKWTAIINFEFTNDAEIKVKAYDSDVTQEEFMGTGSINLKNLKSAGSSEITLFGQDKASIGTVTFDYDLKQLKVAEPVKQQPKLAAVQPKKEESAKIIPKQQIKKIEPVAEKKVEPIVQKKVEPAVQKKVEPVKVEPTVEKKVEQSEKKEVVQQAEQKRTEQVKVQKFEKAEYKGEQNINGSFTKKEDPNASLNKSRNTIRLPQIGDISKNYGDKIFDKQSSATLQKSILVYSMPKAPRFGSGPKYCGEPSYYVDTCFKPNATKGVGFGFGAKRQFPEWMEKNMKENPAPGSYFDQNGRKSEYRLKGPTFGISYKYYEKVTIPKEKSPEKQSSSTRRLVPILRTK